MATVEEDDGEYTLTRKGAIMVALMRCGLDAPLAVAEAIEQAVCKWEHTHVSGGA